MIAKTTLHYAGRPVVRDVTNSLFYLISKHRSYKAARDKVDGLDSTSGVYLVGPHSVGRGKMFWVMRQLPKDKEREGRRKLGLRYKSW